MTTTVANMQQIIVDAICAYADLPKLESSVKTKEDLLVVAEKGLED